MNLLALTGALVLTIGLAAPHDSVALRAQAENSPLVRLHAESRRLVDANGHQFVWRFASGFRLLDYVADGNERAAIGYLDWLRATGFNGVRVFSMLCESWFDLCADDGRRALPRLLTLVAERQLYVEVVALAGTREPAMPPSAMTAHVKSIGSICAEHPACAGIELSNENAHPSQRDELTDISFLRALRRTIPASVMVSLGSNCCGQSDEKEIYPGGEYVTVHADRSGHAWDRVRRIRDLEAISARSERYVVDDEPIGAGPFDETGRRSANPHEFFARGALSRIFGVGATWHCDACLHATVPDVTEAAAAAAFVAGTRIVPDDLQLRFAANGLPESPVRSVQSGPSGKHDTVFAAYAGIDEDRGVLALVGVRGTPRIDFQNGWTAGRVLADRPGVRVIEIVKDAEPSRPRTVRSPDRRYKRRSEPWSGALCDAATLADEP